MLVQDSLPVASALDRRLQVERVGMLERLVAVADPADGRASRDTRSPTVPGLPSASVGSPPNPVGAAAATTIATQMPLGQVVVARVVEVPHPTLVIADVADLRVELAWPPGRGPAPLAGDDVALRVLAHAPLVLQPVPDDEAPGADARATIDDRPVWSDDALRLQRGAAGMTRAAFAATTLPTTLVDGREAPPLAADGAPRDAGPRRFDVPILAVGDGRHDDARTATGASATVASQGASSTALDVVPKPIAADAAAITVADRPLADPGTNASAPRPWTDPAVTAPFVPLVLQGPAWPGQPVELVVRRERADDAFDNPVLDHWCGEVVIDLPHLGRVAGHLSFSMQGLRIRIEGDDEVGVAAMADATGELAATLADADLRLTGLTVAHPSPDTRRAPLAATDFLRSSYGDGLDG